LKADGRDVGAILIGEAFAVPFICGATQCPATPKPWCGEQPISKIKMCGNEWKIAKADPQVKTAGWPAFLSACFKRMKASK
jgi:hypothetical protein